MAALAALLAAAVASSSGSSSSGGQSQQRHKFGPRCQLTVAAQASGHKMGPKCRITLQRLLQSGSGNSALASLLQSASAGSSGKRKSKATKVIPGQACPTGATVEMLGPSKSKQGTVFEKGSRGTVERYDSNDSTYAVRIKEELVWVSETNIKWIHEELAAYPVKLAPGMNQNSGPLSNGETGYIVKYSRKDESYVVRLRSGKLALSTKRAVTVLPVPRNSHHGEWRTGRSSDCNVADSTPLDGLRCTHFNETATQHIKEPHWSCCGVNDEFSKVCLQLGDPNFGTQHVGLWREGGRGRKCSTLELRDGPLCIHPNIEMSEAHWGCCGSTDKTSQACVQQKEELSNHGTEHPGVWRAIGSSIIKRYCSLPNQQDGPVCKHKGITHQSHWSCCGSTEFTDHKCPEDAKIKKPLNNRGSNHKGVWRAHTIQKCSIVGREDGPVCMHGSGLISGNHWSCCGLKDKNSTECPPNDASLLPSPLGGLTAEFSDNESVDPSNPDQIVRFSNNMTAAVLPLTPTHVLSSVVIEKDSPVTTWFVKVKGNENWTIGVVPKSLWQIENYLNSRRAKAVANSKKNAKTTNANSVEMHKKNVTVIIDAAEKSVRLVVNGTLEKTLNLEESDFPLRLGIMGQHKTNITRFESVGAALRVEGEKTNAMEEEEEEIRNNKRVRSNEVDEDEPQSKKRKHSE